MKYQTELNKKIFDFSTSVIIESSHSYILFLIKITIQQQYKSLCSNTFYSTIINSWKQHLMCIVLYMHCTLLHIITWNCEVLILKNAVSVNARLNLTMPEKWQDFGEWILLFDSLILNELVFGCVRKFNFNVLCTFNVLQYNHFGVNPSYSLSHPQSIAIYSCYYI